MIPGTSCLATIVLSLRDKIHSTAEALLKLALIGFRAYPQGPRPPNPWPEVAKIV
jgi:hypothetical protein